MENLINPFEVLDLDDQREWEKLREDPFKQSEMPKEQQRYNLLEEGLWAIKGGNIFSGINVKELSIVPD